MHVKNSVYPHGITKKTNVLCKLNNFVFSSHITLLAYCISVLKGWFVHFHFPGKLILIFEQWFGGFHVSCKLDF